MLHPESESVTSALPPSVELAVKFTLSPTTAELADFVTSSVILTTSTAIPLSEGYVSVTESKVMRANPFTPVLSGMSVLNMTSVDAPEAMFSLTVDA